MNDGNFQLKTDLKLTEGSERISNDSLLDKLIDYDSLITEHGSLGSRIYNTFGTRIYNPYGCVTFGDLARRYRDYGWSSGQGGFDNYLTFFLDTRNFGKKSAQLFLKFLKSQGYDFSQDFVDRAVRQSS